MDLMDPEGLVTSRLFREHCHFFDGNYFKDLSMLGRHPMNICIIDNSPKAYMLHPASGIPITSWFDDPNDTALLDYIPWLSALSQVTDVRQAIKQIVQPDNTLDP